MAILERLFTIDDQPLVYGAELALDADALNQMTILLQRGLTRYGDPEQFEAAKADLIAHIQHSQVRLVCVDGEIKGYGIYDRLGPDIVEISRILSPELRGQGVGKMLVLDAGAQNPDAQIIASRTQNPSAYGSIASALGANLIAPILSEDGTEFMPIGEEAMQILHTFATLKSVSHLPNSSISQGSYGASMYAEKFNSGLPLDQKRGDAALIVGYNPYYSPNGNS
jgi:hypothetical protein